MAADLAPRIIVLALGAGALGFPDALRHLLQVAGRSPLRDIFICVFAMAVITAQALGTMLLVRFVRKETRAAAAAGAGGDAPGTSPPDRFAQVTLVVSVAAAFLVFACLLVASGAGAGGLGMLYLVADIARERPVIAVLVAGCAAAVIPCSRPLLRVVFRVHEEDHSQDGASAAASTPSTGTGRFANMILVTNFTGAAAATLLAMSGGLYIQRGALVGVPAVVGAMFLLARFTRTPRNAADAGGDHAAPISAADTFGKLTTLAPYMAIVSSALICLVLTTYPCSA